MFWIITLFTWLLATVAGQRILDLPDSMDKSSCIPLPRLQDASVQRGLGEMRKIKKVNVYLTGNGSIDMVVSIATSFKDEDFTKPLLHKCEDYQGSADNVVVSLNCLDDHNKEGLDGYAVFVKFYGNVSNNPAAICQMDIILRDKKADEKRQMVRSTAIAFGVICSLISLTGVCIVIWYYFTQRESSVEEICENISTAEEPRKQRVSSRLGSNYNTFEARPANNNADDYEDDVFSPLDPPTIQLIHNILH